MALQRPAGAAPPARMPTTSSGQILDGEGKGGNDHANHHRSADDRRANHTTGAATTPGSTATRAPTKTPSHSLDSVDGRYHDSGVGRRSRHVVRLARGWPHHSGTSSRVAGLLAAVLGCSRTRANAIGHGIPGRVGAGDTAGLLAALHVCGRCHGPHGATRGRRHIPRLLAALCGDGSDC